LVVDLRARMENGRGMKRPLCASLLISALMGVAAPVLAQDRPAKDADEVQARYGHLADRYAREQRCDRNGAARTAGGADRAETVRSSVTLTAPERFSAMQVVARAAAARLRCTW
jgi:hypothetical protein